MLAEIALNEGEREKLQGANYRRNLYNKVPFFHALPLAYKFLSFLSFVCFLSERKSHATDDD